MIKTGVQKDFGELLFRLLFSTIFLGLGAEHVFQDDLIQGMMPAWLPYKRLCSLFSGTVLLIGGSMVLCGYRVYLAGFMLGVFIIAVTALVHAPSIFSYPAGLAQEWHWLWDVYQRSNFVKNLCLLGVCFHLLHHQVGRFSLDTYLQARKAS